MLLQHRYEAPFFSDEGMKSTKILSCLTNITELEIPWFKHHSNKYRFHKTRYLGGPNLEWYIISHPIPMIKSTSTAKYKILYSLLTKHRGYLQLYLYLYTCNVQEIYWHKTEQTQLVPRKSENRKKGTEKGKNPKTDSVAASKNKHDRG